MIFSIAGLDILQEIREGIAGEALLAFDLCYVGPDGKFYRACAANRATMPGLVLAATDVPSGGAGQFIRRGKVTNNDWTFTVGQLVHASVQPGALTHDFPGSREQLQIVGVALAANQIDFDPNLILIEVA